MEAPTPHVLQVFDVNGRNAAQHAHRQVERAAGNQAGLDAHGLGRNIRNDAQPVALVEDARLPWNVRCRIVQPEIAFQAAAGGFRNHLARAVVIEAVDHHSVEAGEAAHLARRDPVEGPEVGCLL
jgi:hypothetical protein